MKLSVLIPAKNEQGTIVEILSRVRSALARQQIAAEILVIDDGSDDATAILAQAVPGVQLLQLHPGRGKGAAVRAGIDRAQGEIILVQDADLEYDPADYPALLQPLLSGEAQVVYGSRVLGERAGFKVRSSKLRFYLGGRFLSWVTSVLFNCRITDEATGYKVFQAKLLRELKLNKNGFEFCPEVTAKILKRGIPIREVPISYQPRSLAEGKKIRWWDGLNAVLTLLQIRLGRSVSN